MTDARGTRVAGPRPAGAEHLAGGRPGRGRRRGAVAAGIVLVAAGVAAGSMVVAGGGDGGGGVVLVPATASSADDPFPDLDLMPADERAASVEASTAEVARADEADEPVELAGLAVRGTQPLVYAAGHDEPTCDLAPLVGAAEGDADGDLGRWFALVAGGGDDGAAGEDGGAVDREEVVAQLTPVRLRHDTRVTMHGPDGGDAGADGRPAVLQAGTAVLIDGRGVPRVRCTGGVPLSEPVAAEGLDAADALDADVHVANGDEAWEAFDPREVVVVERGAEEGEFEVADVAGGAPFTRPAGTNGDRDWREAQSGRDACGVCPTIVVTAESVTGTPAEIEAVAGGVPSDETAGGLTWSHADPGTYGWSVTHAHAQVDTALFGLDETASAPPEGPVDDPAHEGDDTVVVHVVEPAGLVVETWQCLPGDVTVTVRVAGEVVSTTTHTVPCGADAAVTGEYVLAG